MDDHKPVPKPRTVQPIEKPVPKPRTIKPMLKPIPKPCKSDEEYEESIILPPPEFRDHYKPVPKPRTIKHLVKEYEENIISPPIKFRDTLGARGFSCAVSSVGHFSIVTRKSPKLS